MMFWLLLLCLLSTIQIVTVSDHLKLRRLTNGSSNNHSNQSRKSEKKQRKRVTHSSMISLKIVKIIQPSDVYQMLYNFKQIGDFQRISLAIWFKASFSFNKIMRKRNTFYFSRAHRLNHGVSNGNIFILNSVYSESMMPLLLRMIQMFEIDLFICIKCTSSTAQHWMQQMCNFIAAFDAIYCYLIKKKTVLSGVFFCWDEMLRLTNGYITLDELRKRLISLALHSMWLMCLLLLL